MVVKRNAKVEIFYLHNYFQVNLIGVVNEKKDPDERLVQEVLLFCVSHKFILTRAFKNSSNLCQNM